MPHFTHSSTLKWINKEFVRFTYFFPLIWLSIVFIRTKILLILPRNKAKEWLAHQMFSRYFLIWNRLAWFGAFRCCLSPSRKADFFKDVSKIKENFKKSCIIHIILSQFIDFELKWVNSVSILNEKWNFSTLKSAWMVKMCDVSDPNMPVNQATFKKSLMRS